MLNAKNPPIQEGTTLQYRAYPPAKNQETSNRPSTDPVVLLHGGPGAPGEMAPVARELARRGFDVLEPFQRGSSSGLPLTVEQHLLDLAAFLTEHGLHERPFHLVGFSWGAMLAVIMAAHDPNLPFRQVIMIASGTFDQRTRQEYKGLLSRRGGAKQAIKLQALTTRHDRGDMDAKAYRLQKINLIYHGSYMVEPLTDETELLDVDLISNQQSWQDMLTLQTRGVYPEALKSVRCPVHMIHGEQDPHPGRSTARLLKRHIPHLTTAWLDQCGHYPWFEKYAQEVFFVELEESLLECYDKPCPESDASSA